MQGQAQRDFIDKARVMAAGANHPFPEYAACEAALESTFGLSGLARKANNLFGMKAHDDTKPSLSLPTHEYINGQMIEVMAKWAIYPTYEECFVDRLLTLQRLRWKIPAYDAALKATNGPDFVIEVSKSWSTDPRRAAKVLEIHQEFFKQ